VAAVAEEEEPKVLLVNKQIRRGLGRPASGSVGATLPPPSRARGGGAERGSQTRVAPRGRGRRWDMSGGWGGRVRVELGMRKKTLRLCIYT
jgi:hypothetical protein